MKTTSLRKRVIASVTSVAVVVGLSLGIPTQARAADPQCQVASGITQCAGATTSGALYTLMAPLNFNGTVLLWSHGLRPNVDLPVGLPGGYSGLKVNKAAEFAPGQSDGDLTTTYALLAQGYGLAGSGFSREGVNVTQAVAENVEVLEAFKKKFTNTSKVVAWGASLGTLITQRFAEKYPNLVDATALVCPATAPSEALSAYFGDFMWGFKTFFDPSIKGFGYSAGTEGYIEMQKDLGKFFTALGFLQANVVTGAWPSTSSAAGKALEAAKVPSRSALVLVGLMAGVPMRSQHVDGVSAPTGLELSYPLAIAPAIATIENAATVGLAEILLMHDGEDQTGGVVFDNTKTDYASRVDAERDIYSVALSGGDATDKMLQILAASPRVTGSPAAIAKMKDLVEVKGQISKPTVLVTTESDQFTVAGAGQWLIDKYAAQFAAEKQAAINNYKATKSYVAPQKKLLAIWDKTATKYSKFTAAGSPDLTAPDGDGTGHCKFSSAQMLAVAKVAISAANTGNFPQDGPVATAMRKVGFSYDRKFYVAPFKALQ